MECLLHDLQEMIVKIIDIKHSPPWDEIDIMKELDHPAIVKVTFCFFSSSIVGNIYTGSVTPCHSNSLWVYIKVKQMMIIRSCTIF